MEQQKPKEAQESGEKLEDLRKELAELRERKRLRDLMEKKAAQIVIAVQDTDDSGQEMVSVSPEDEVDSLDDLEKRLNDIDGYLIKQVEEADNKTYSEHSEYIESELQSLEGEIKAERGQIEQRLSPYEVILKQHPWLGEKRYEFMYTIPDKKKQKKDYDSWREEWAKVLYDYAKYAILHILFIRNLNTEKPFSNFTNREESLKEISDELIEQKLARWINKKRKDKLRVYWRTLEGWADEIYNWAHEQGKLEPVLIYEFVEAQEEFSSLPKEEFEDVFKILEKSDRGRIIKLDDGDLAIKIDVD